MDTSHFLGGLHATPGHGVATFYCQPPLWWYATNVRVIIYPRFTTPLIYPRPGNIPLNVPKFRYDPPELANAWQKIQSVHLPSCLDRKSITCVARDRLRHISYPKYPHLIQPFIPYVRVLFPLSHACIWSPLSTVEGSTRRLTHRDFVAELHTDNRGSFRTYQLQKAFNKGQCPFLNG
jgi:hypothetical protein